MVRLILGVKGSGKTKQLIEMINNAAKDEPGSVVCISQLFALFRLAFAAAPSFLT